MYEQDINLIIYSNLINSSLILVMGTLFAYLDNSINSKSIYKQITFNNKPRRIYSFNTQMSYAPRALLSFVKFGLSSLVINRIIGYLWPSWEHINLPWYYSILRIWISLEFIIFNFYWCHRLLHIEPLYRLFHKQHHEKRSPFVFIGFDLSYIEGILFFVIPSSFIAVITFMPCYELAFIASFITFNVLISHSGRNIKYISNNSLHDSHHWFFTYNYGTGGSRWDKFFGTYKYLVPEN
jgi:sterol desaturase/sphingolipid hydroxylase (fatty acid hydroxylase superfamily)